MGEAVTSEIEVGIEDGSGDGMVGDGVGISDGINDALGEGLGDPEAVGVGDTIFDVEHFVDAGAGFM